MTFWKWSKTPATNATADGSCPFPENMSGAALNDGTRGMMAAAAKYRDDNNGSLTTGGTSTAFTLSSNQVFDTLAHLDGQTLAFTMSATSGAAPTLNVDGLGAVPIRFATGVAPPTGALLSGSVYHAKYGNSAGEFLVLNQAGVLTIPAASVTYAEIQNVAAVSLLGNTTGGAAAPSEITLGAGLAFSGSTLVGSSNPQELAGYLSGLTLSTAGGSAAFGIAAGGACDDASDAFMSMSSAYTKTTGSWAVGSGNGALDTGTIAPNTSYSVFIIKRPDTGVVDYVVSLSATAPILPANYTKQRRLGSMKTDGSNHWILFHQDGDDFLWDANVVDVNAATTVNTNSSLLTLSVPTGVKVDALFIVEVTSGGGGNHRALFSSPDMAQQTPAVGTSNLFCANSATVAESFRVRTNTSGQIRYQGSSVSGTYTLTTYGWRDRRGK